MIVASDARVKREFLRHTVATLAYRGGKVVRGAPDGFGTVRASETGRSAVEIVAHLGDLLVWALGLARGQQKWPDETPQSWDLQVDRFFEGLRRLDELLASDEPLGNPPEKLFQGPIADAINHVGQIAVLRRIAGSPVRGENYFKAEIAVGRVGPEQSSKRVEFD
ncbi:MAG TPA: hypothetical protein VFM39_06780 [bacterium]|nr:hypothetical protein [bacterium]